MSFHQPFVHVVEAYDGYVRPRVFQRLPTEDPDILRCREEMKKRGLLKDEDIAKPNAPKAKPVRAGKYRRKTHCNNGHPRTPENIYKGGTCRPCQLHRTRMRYAPNYLSERKEA